VKKLVLILSLVSAGASVFGQEVVQQNAEESSKIIIREDLNGPKSYYFEDSYIGSLGAFRKLYAQKGHEEALKLIKASRVTRFALIPLLIGGAGSVFYGINEAFYYETASTGVYVSIGVGAGAVALGIVSVVVSKKLHKKSIRVFNGEEGVAFRPVLDPIQGSYGGAMSFRF